MPVDRFLDTNILLYGYDLDADSKRPLALSLMDRGWEEPGSTAVSVQVLQEFYVNSVRQGLAVKNAGRIIEDLCAWPVVDNNVELLGKGLSLSARYKISFWDAMIVAAAQECGARELVTEDLNDGQEYDGVLVRNPFRDS